MRQIAILSLLFLPFLSLAQIKKVRVETYYISDSLDATDTTDFRVLEAGSSTYRIFVDLLPGSKIYKIYGDRYHKLKIKSSANFYNNINRPNAYFGYLINKSWFGGNPTLALDSWLTLGLATKTNQGILKKDDTDGSFIGGSFNGGGSSSIPGGILKNSDPFAGIPITVSDGLASFTGSFSQWSDVGFKDGLNIDTTVFGSVKIGSEFISTSDAYLQQSGGVSGFNSDSNSVLIAQLTTKGAIEFEINLY
jgi:hypothetical protein